MEMTVETVSFPMKAPFAITGRVFHETQTVRVTLVKGGVKGRGEGAGVYYLEETVESMTDQLQSVRDAVTAGAARQDIQGLLPPGGARNALDCAYWDLEAKAAGARVWDRLKISSAPLSTLYTIGLAEPGTIAARAKEAAVYPQLKIKLDADRPVEKIKAIRAARPDAALIVDVNQGWSFDALCEYAPALADFGVAMIEQPLPRGEDAALEGYVSPIPLGADESCLHSEEFDALKDIYDVFNIKLDKTGGLTEALRLADCAADAGKALMVGNMMGSSLSMAPSFVIGQLCRFVDIDGPLLLEHDVEDGLVYEEGGRVEPPSAALWG